MVFPGPSRPKGGKTEKARKTARQAVPRAFVSMNSKGGEDQYAPIRLTAWTISRKLSALTLLGMEWSEEKM